MLHKLIPDLIIFEYTDMTEAYDNINESLINYHTVQRCDTLFTFIENCHL